MLIVGAQLESYRSLKDKTLKLSFETQEPSPEQLTEIAKASQKFGYLAFKEDNFKTDELEVLNGLKSDYEDKGKSKSQRLRAVLYKNFEQDNLGYKVFDDFYNRKMEELINHFKGKLD
ncbi:hypothetical protein J0X14_14435 [Muricauda sp. CAU 1633]|uniref:hypothetical protein n=1 Tax=Allomuricauda sp. CAU 1633 TaxID=2816036 RepID=UPI001A8D5CB6|nr:hypothetical protein [Muricauda sp. CAU 1633]MBO0323503.1 hypothetical protein [Muricauda sp. CAU 1633]